MHRSLVASALLFIACGTKADSAGTSSTGVAEPTSESGDVPWPESCAEHVTQAACDAVVGQYGCEWVEIFALQLGTDACETTVLRFECVAFEIHGNGCSGFIQCGDTDVPTLWYRPGADGLEYTRDRCEQVPPSWAQCSGTEDAPAECACACLDAD
jgi:hypothetical protein